MKKSIAKFLAGLSLIGLPGCESNAEPSTVQLVGYQVDAARERTWWLTKDSVVLHSASHAPKSVKLPGWLWLAAPYCPPALALGPDGEAVITSNAAPILWRVDPETLAVTVREVKLDTDHGRDIGFAAIVYSHDQAAFMAYSEQRSVWKIDRELAHATKMATADLNRRSAQRARPGSGPCSDLGQRLSRVVGQG